MKVKLSHCCEDSAKVMIEIPEQILKEMGWNQSELLEITCVGNELFIEKVEVQ